MPKLITRHVRGECTQSDKDCCGEAQQHRSVQRHVKRARSAILKFTRQFINIDNPISSGVKPPWRYTGTWSLPTYLHYTASGLDYKKFSPGSPPVKARCMPCPRVRLRFHQILLKSSFNPAEQSSCRLLSPTHLPSWCMTSNTTVRACCVCDSISLPIPASAAAWLWSCSVWKQDTRVTHFSLVSVGRFLRSLVLGALGCAPMLAITKIS